MKKFLSRTLTFRRSIRHLRVKLNWNQKMGYIRNTPGKSCGQTYAGFGNKTLHLLMTHWILMPYQGERTFSKDIQSHTMFLPLNCVDEIKDFWKIISNIHPESPFLWRNNWHTSVYQLCISIFFTWDIGHYVLMN